MIRRPFNTIRRFSHNHKPSFEIDYANWHKSEEFKVKINSMSNKIDDIHFTMETAKSVLGGCLIGAGIGLSIPVFIEVFKHFF